MKTTGNMRGGSLKTSLLYNCASCSQSLEFFPNDPFYPSDAEYLLKAVQAFISKGVNVYAISIQNEPLYSDSTYPTSTLTADNEAKIGIILKALLKNNDLSSVKLIGMLVSSSAHTQGLPIDFQVMNIIGALITLPNSCKPLEIRLTVLPSIAMGEQSVSKRTSKNYIQRR